MTSPAPAPFCVPHGRNPLFVRRAADLERLERLLAEGGATAALCGVGGLGKTQLAVEYAHAAWAAGHYLGGVFWLVMDTPAGVAGQVAALGGPDGLALAGWDPGQAEQNTALVQAAWKQPVARLLVFDNCEDPALLAAWRPPVGGCRVLVTSRNTAWPARLGVQVFRLGLLPRPASLDVVLRPRAQGQGRTVADLLADAATLRDADALADWLGDLPLALALAAAYLESYPSITLADYRAGLEADQLAHESLHPPPARQPIPDHDPSMQFTFLRSYAALDDRVPIDVRALRLLHQAAWCAPGVAIPRRLLVRSVGLDPEVPRDQGQADEALHRLASLGLIAFEADGSLLLHRLLAAYTQARADNPAADQAAVEAALLAEIIPLNAARNPQPAAPYVEHLRHAAQAGAGRDDRDLALLLNELAVLLQYRGEYGAARPLYERALAIREQALGPTDPDTASSLNNLAGLLRAQGDYGAARPLHERALAIWEQEFGPSHPLTATSLNNLALLLEAQGDYGAARPLYERALAIREQALGPTDPDTATSLNNLAELLRAQGDYGAARPLYERALAIDEAALGPHHPGVASDLNNLALLLEEQGEYAAARPLYERAIAIYEQMLGPSHPATAQSLNNLADLLDAQGEYGAARPLYERALAIREQALGPSHPATAQSLNNLAVLLENTDDQAAARSLYERAVAICERALGPDHPDTRAARANLGRLRRRMGEGGRPALDPSAPPPPPQWKK